MKLLARIIAAGGCLLLIGSAAAAQPPNWYGGASLGQGNLDISTKEWDDGTVTSPKLDKGGVSYKLIAGLHLNSWFGLEAAYMHFSDVRFSGYETQSVSTVWKPGPIHGSALVKGVSLQGVFDRSFYKERFSVFAKGGVLFWNTTMKSQPTIAGGTLAVGDELLLHDDGYSGIFGAGADMRFHDNWRVRLEWEFSQVGLSGFVDHNVNIGTLGVTREF